MFELQQMGMQRLARKGRHGSRHPWRQCVDFRPVTGTIIAVTNERMSDMGQVNADLMGSARFKATLQQ